MAYERVKPNYNSEAVPSRLAGVERPGRGVDHLYTPSAEVKVGIKPYL